MSASNEPNESVASPILKTTISEKLRGFMFGHDIFISYSRADAIKYAPRLANYLTKLGFVCYLDQLGATPDKKVPDSVKKAIRRSTAFVLIGTEAAARSTAVGDEIEVFLEKPRVILPINVEGALPNAIWYPMIAGLAMTSEAREAIEKGKPSREVLSRIYDSSKFTRRNKRLNRVFWITLAAIAVLITTGSIAALFLWKQAAAADKLRADAEIKALQAQIAVVVAEAQTRFAEAQEVAANQKAAAAATRQKDAEDKEIIARNLQKVAEGRASEADAKAREAEGKAIKAEGRARTANAKAEMQQKIASSLQMANQAESVRGETAQNLIVSALLGVESVERYRTLEGDRTLRRNMALLPQLARSDPKADLVEFDRNDRLINREAVIIRPGGGATQGFSLNRFLVKLVPGYAIEAQELSGGKKRNIPLDEMDCSYNGCRIDISRDGTYVAAAQGRKVRVWVFRDGQYETLISHAFDEDEKAIDEMKISPDGNYLVVSSNDTEDNYIVVRNIKKGGWTSLSSPLEGAEEIAFSPDSKYLAVTGLVTNATNGKDYKTMVWKTPDSEEALDSESDPDAIPRSIFGGSSIEEAFSSDQDRQVDKEEFEEIATIENTSVGGLAVSNQGHVASAKARGASARDDTVSVWKRGEEVARIPVAVDGNIFIAFSDDSRHLLVADQSERSIMVWATSGIREIQQVETCWPVGALAFSADGQQLATLPAPPGLHISFDCDRKGGDYLSLIDIKSRKIETSSSPELNGHTALSPDLKYLATYAYEFGPLKVFSNPGGYPVATVPWEAKLMALAVAPAAKYVAVSEYVEDLNSEHGGGTFFLRIGRVIDNQYKVTKSLPFNREINDIAFSLDGEFLVAALEGDHRTGSTVRVFKSTTLEEVAKFHFDSKVNAVALSSRGKYVAAASDRTTKIWEVASKRPVSAVEEGKYPVRAIAFDPDDRRIATASGPDEAPTIEEPDDNVVRIWLFDSGDMIKEARSRLPRQSLTEEECREYAGDDPFYKPCQQLMDSPNPAQHP